jgi:hypothetical protein
MNTNLLFGISCFVVGVVVGGNIKFLIDDNQQKNVGWAIDPTMAERDAGVVIGETLPGKVTIHFVTPEAIRSVHAAFAYASAGTNKCDIYYPTGRKIKALIADPISAQWVNPFDAEAFPHELLHCFRGAWHAPDSEER